MPKESKAALSVPRRAASGGGAFDNMSMLLAPDKQLLLVLAKEIINNGNMPPWAGCECAAIRANAKSGKSTVCARAHRCYIKRPIAM